MTAVKSSLQKINNDIYNKCISGLNNNYNIKTNKITIMSVFIFIVGYMFINRVLQIVKLIADLFVFTLVPFIKCTLHVLPNIDRYDKKEKTENKSIAILGEILIITFLRIVTNYIYVIDYVPILSMLRFPIECISIFMATIIQFPRFTINRMLTKAINRYEFLNDNIYVDVPLSNHLIIWLKRCIGNETLNAIHIIEKITEKYNDNKEQFKLTEKDNEELIVALEILGIDINYLSNFNTNDMNTFVKYMDEVINVILYRSYKMLFSDKKPIKDLISEIIDKVAIDKVDKLAINVDSNTIIKRIKRIEKIENIDEKAEPEIINEVPKEEAKETIKDATKDITKEETKETIKDATKETTKEDDNKVSEDDVKELKDTTKDANNKASKGNKKVSGNKSRSKQKRGQ